jgi:hypothetical protein
MGMALTIEEFRLAIHQTHSCDSAELIEVVPVAVDGGGDGAPASVHVFAVRHRKASRCYAWPEAVGAASLVVHCILAAGPVDSPEAALAFVRRKDARNARARQS